MKDHKVWKKLAAGLLFALLAMAAAVPVSAAKTYTKSREKIVSRNESFHIMDKNISKNKVKRYRITFIPETKGTRYDVAAGVYNQQLGGTVVEMRRSQTAGMEIVTSNCPYIKEAEDSEEGMAACIHVHKGRVRVQVTAVSRASAKGLVFVRQEEGHQTLEKTAVKKGGSVLFVQRGSNVRFLSVIMGAKAGAQIQRTLSADKYERYIFRAGSMTYQFYKNGKRLNRYTSARDYDVVYGADRYISLLTETNLSGQLRTTKSTAYYFYPADYVQMQVVR